MPGWAQYRSPIKGLYMCGSATHPGGGIMGANGRIAAMALLMAPVPPRANPQARNAPSISPM